MNHLTSNSFITNLICNENEKHCRYFVNNATVEDYQNLQCLKIKHYGYVKNVKIL